MPNSTVEQSKDQFQTDNQSKTRYFASLDMDGAVFNTSKYLALYSNAKTIKEKESQEQEEIRLSKAGVIRANVDLITHLQKIKIKYKNTTLMLGTYRQSSTLDLSNSICRFTTTSCSGPAALTTIAETIGCSINKFMLTDIEQDCIYKNISGQEINCFDYIMEDGWGNAINRVIHQDEAKNRISEPYDVLDIKKHDKNKLYLLETHINSIAATYPDNYNIYELIDDRIDILENLLKHFSTNIEKILPKNITLVLQSYNGDFTSNPYYKEIKGKAKIPSVKSIPVNNNIENTGIDISNYKFEIEKIAELEGYLVNKPIPKTKSEPEVETQLPSISDDNHAGSIYPSLKAPLFFKRRRNNSEISLSSKPVIGRSIESRAASLGNLCLKLELTVTDVEEGESVKLVSDGTSKPSDSTQSSTIRRLKFT